MGRRSDAAPESRPGAGPRGRDTEPITAARLIEPMVWLLHAGTLGGGVALLAVSLAAAPLSGWWVANLLTNFRPQFALIGLVVLALGLALRTWHIALIGAAVVAVNTAVIADRLWPPAEAGALAEDRPVLRVMTLNLLFSNRDVDAIARYVTQAEPDLLLLQEVNGFWSDALERLDDLFPYRVEPRRLGPWDYQHGVMLLSRYPILDREAPDLGGWPARFAASRLAVDGQTVWAASVHAVKPATPRSLALQQRQLEQLAAWANARDEPVIVGGDLNATAYSPQVQRLAATSGLQLDQQAARSWWSRLLATTYPADLPVLGLKLDHVMVRGASFRRAWTGPRSSSDHRAVVVDVVLEKGSRPSTAALP